MTRDQFAIAYEFSGIIPQFELTSADLKDGLLGSPGGMLSVDVDKLYDKIQAEAAPKGRANQPPAKSQQVQSAAKQSPANLQEGIAASQEKSQQEQPTTQSKQAQAATEDIKHQRMAVSAQFSMALRTTQKAQLPS